ncbi:hypothetical protein [Microbacterium sp. CGR1]|uniref:hypothetical protein n=1 Tax=Microbacterium sp. CGR1 TaxID=1696072 RepID=UPI000AA17175|nr:hypothetical protein [Microbacterium sp. CGR1]
MSVWASSSEFSPRSSPNWPRAIRPGIAAGVYNSLRTLGGSAAGAVFAVLLAGFTASGSLSSSIGGYITIWSVCAGAFIISALALAFMRMPRLTDSSARKAHS